jgi:hypothetical protein
MLKGEIPKVSNITVPSQTVDNHPKSIKKIIAKKISVLPPSSQIPYLTALAHDLTVEELQQLDADFMEEFLNLDYGIE